MADPLDAKRTAPRVPLKIDLSERLLIAKDRVPLRCLATDVSRNGLGIVCFEDLEQGTETFLMAGDKAISLFVVWCKRDQVRKNIFHIGLHTDNPAYNLVKTLTDIGLLTQAKEPPAAEEKAPETQPNITFETIKQAICTAHTSDPKIFETSGLDQLSKSHRAFPIRHGNVSLVVLLPRELKPAEAGKLNNQDAEGKVNIFKWTKRQGESPRLKRIWPDTGKTGS